MTQYLVSSVFKNTGTAKATGKPFQMNRISVLQPFVETNASTFQSHGAGLSVVELSVGDNIFDDLEKHFRSRFKGSPVSIELETALDRDSRAVVIGYKPLSPAVAA